MAAPRQPNSLRQNIRVIMLSLLAAGRYGSCKDVEEKIEPEGYHPNTLKVQISQMRNFILDEVGIKLPFTVKGRLSGDKIRVIEQKLSHPGYHARLIALAKAA